MFQCYNQLRMLRDSLLPFAVPGQAALFPQNCKNLCLQGSSSDTKGGNKCAITEQNDTNILPFGVRKRLVQLLFCCQKKRGRALSPTRPVSLKQIATNVQVQDADTQTAFE